MLSTTTLTSQRVKQIARDAGFALAGIARPEHADFARYQAWLDAGFHADMDYLADHRGTMRKSAKDLFPACRSVISLGTLYQTPLPHTRDFNDTERGWISRYAWGEDYHEVLKSRLKQFAALLQTEHGPFAWKACVDTSPLLERSYARLAGLGWIGKNTCLINQEQGSWFFLSELLVDLELEADAPAPERCGSCTRCIDVCPTQAIVPSAAGWWTIDSRLCISYLTIEHRGEIRADLRAGLGPHVFGCDLCQDVCPWNRRSPVTDDPSFHPTSGEAGIDLGRMACLSEEEFRKMFRPSPVSRAKYSGFLRNVALAIGNARTPAFVPHLERLAGSDDPVVVEAARWALAQALDEKSGPGELEDRC